MKPHISWCCFISSIAFEWLAIASNVQAQIVPDNTLPINSSVTNSCFVCTIEAGTERGVNLYHSFREFSIPTNGEAYFNNGLQIQNILTRVTGSQISNIDGLIRSNGSANLFFLNPNGIVFGPNARLQIGGSFYATTANSFQFPDANEFSVTPPNAPPLLTINVASGLQRRVTEQPLAQAPIAVAGQLTVNNGQRLTLVGSDILNRGSLIAPGGTVQLLGDRVALLENAQINVSSGMAQGNGGNVLIRSNRNTQIYGQITAQAGPLGGNGGWVETSSLSTLRVLTPPNVAAPNGLPGNWLIDPNNITIVANGLGTINIDPANPFQTIGDAAQIEVGVITTALQTGNVTLTTAADGNNSEPGNITLATPLNFDGIGNDRTLTLNATNNIVIANPIQDNDPATPDSLNLVLNANQDRQDFGAISLSASINTGGGNIQMNGFGDTEPGILNLGNLNSQGGTIALNGISNSEAGVVNVAPLNSGGGDITITGISDRGFGIGNFGSTINSQGGNISLTGISQTNVGFSAGGSTVNSGPGNLTLTADRLSLPLGSFLQGQGELVIQPVTPGLNLELGGTDTPKFLNETAFQTIQNGFQNITIGRADGTGQITLTDAILINDPFTLRSPLGNGSVVLNGQLLGFDDAAVQVITNSNITGTGSIFNFYAGLENPITLISTNGTIALTGSLISGGNNTVVGDIFLSAFGDLNVGNMTTSGDLNKSGNITLISQTGSIDTRAGRLNTNNFRGSGGTVELRAARDIFTAAIDSAGTSGRGGEIILNSAAGKIDTTAGNLVSGSRAQTSGNIFLTALGDIVTGNINAGSNAFQNSNSGNITIISLAGNVDTRPGLVRTTARGGRGGDLLIQAKGDIYSNTIQTLGSDAGRSSIGDAGDIQLSAEGNIVVGDLLALSSRGEGGDVDIRSPQRLQIGSIFTIGGEGSGNISIATGQPFVLSNAVIASDTFGLGRGGDIDITAPSIALREGAQISASTRDAGRGGDIRLSAQQIEISGTTPNDQPPLIPEAASRYASFNGILPAQYLDGFIPTSKFPGPSGTQYPSGVFTQTAIGSTGAAGNLTIATQQLSLRNKGTISATTFGSAPAGNITIQGDNNPTSFANQVIIENASILSGVAPEASANSGIIRLQTRSLNLSNGGVIQSQALGRGDAGEIRVIAPESVSLTGVNSETGLVSGFRSGTSLNGQRGGNITVITNDFQLANRATLDTQTQSDQPGGNITVNATQLNISGGGQMLTATRGGGKAGDIDLTIADRFNLIDLGSGLFANTNLGSAGAGGNIIIDSQRVDLRNNAEIAVGSKGTGVGGSITIDADSLTLSRANINAETASNQGGNIQLDTNNLLFLRNRSLISATAGTDRSGGDGGNIVITAPFLISVLIEDSDIRANAFQGNGGDITINANQIFGLRPQPQNTRFSDITASSTLGVNGNVTLNILNIDPSRGLEDPNLVPVDPAKLVAQTCNSNRRVVEGESRFVVVGRGGLPASPDVPLGGGPILSDLAIPNSNPQKSSIQTPIIGPMVVSPATSQTSQSEGDIIEAQSFVQAQDGSLYLVADVLSNPSAIPSSQLSQKQRCD